MIHSNLSDDAILELINNVNAADSDFDDVSEDDCIADLLGVHNDIEMDIDESLEDNDDNFMSNTLFYVIYSNKGINYKSLLITYWSNDLFLYSLLLQFKNISC